MWFRNELSSLADVSLFSCAKGGRCVELIPYHLHVPNVLKSGILNLLSPSGPHYAQTSNPLNFARRLSSAWRRPIIDKRLKSMWTGQTPVPVVAQSKSQVWSCFISWVAGSNPAKCMDVSFECRVLSEVSSTGRSLVQRTPSRCACLIVCDLETLTIRWPRSELEFWATKKYTEFIKFHYIHIVAPIRLHVTS